MSAPSSARQRPSARSALGALGVLVLAYGVWLLLSREDLAGILDVALWLGAGVLVHDLLLSSLLLVLGALTVRLLPGHARAAVAAGVVVLGSLTLMAVPVLGRFGAKDSNPTLLDRPYLLGWLLLALLVGAVVTVVVLLRRRRADGA